MMILTAGVPLPLSLQREETANVTAREEEEAALNLSLS